MPWVVYHFFRSVFLQSAYQLPVSLTFIRTHIAFLPRFPEWLNFLTNDLIMVLSASRLFAQDMSERAMTSLSFIPTQNLRDAYAYMRGLFVINHD